MSCVLRVSGYFAPEQFLSQSAWFADSLWRSGEPRRHGRIAPDSGFTVVVTEAGFEAIADQVADAIVFLQQHEAEFARLRSIARSVVATLDFGVAQRAQPAWSLALPAELVEQAGRCRVGIEVTLYAVSEAQEIT